MELMMTMARATPDAVAGDWQRAKSRVDLCVIHVVATGQRRGAEMFAADLIAGLEPYASRQLVVVLRPDTGVDGNYDVPVVALSSRRPVPGLNLDPTTLWALHSTLRGADPQIVQAYGSEALKYAASLTARSKWKLVYRKIGATAPWATRGPRRVLQKALMRRANRIVAVSDSVKREIVETFGISSSKVVSIPRGVDPGRLHASVDRADMRSALGVPSNAHVVLSLGALTWEKDPLAHVAVMSKVVDRDPHAYHLIVGDGPLRSQVEAAVDEAGNSSRTILLANRGDVGDLLAASDVMLLASRTEGMPGCLIEAGIGGLASACYDVGGAAEIIDHGVTGFITPVGEVDELAGRVLELCNDADLRQRLGTNARERCRRFEIDLIATQYRDLYRGLMAEESAR